MSLGVLQLSRVCGTKPDPYAAARERGQRVRLTYTIPYLLMGQTSFFFTCELIRCIPLTCRFKTQVDGEGVVPR